MGVLDEAIRQHLELKRRHGASEDDLQREEAEALGPARREMTSAGADERPEPEAVAEPEGEAQLPPEPPLAAVQNDQRAELLPEEGSLEAFGDEPDEVPSSEWLEATAREKDEGLTYRDEPEEQRAPEDDAGEDMLEETPDFLHDAPEHDQLGFEAKPRRDFDFD